MSYNRTRLEKERQKEYINDKKIRLKSYKEKEKLKEFKKLKKSNLIMRGDDIDYVR